MNNQEKAMRYFDVYKKHCRAKFALAEIKTIGGKLAYAMVDMEMLREYVHMDSTASKKQAETGGESLRFKSCKHSDKMLRRYALAIVETGMTEAEFLEWAENDSRHFDEWEDDSIHLNRGQAGEHLFYILQGRDDWHRDNSAHWKRGDIIFNGKSCQIKMSLGTLLTKTECERWQ